MTNQLPSEFCWSKMGVESGEGLLAILRRKEMERRANDGLFVWGIGSPLGGALGLLAAKNPHPKAVFTAMKSKAKAVDVSPTRILLWLSYLDAHGVERPLPEFSFVVSRGETEAARHKRAHYALLCTAESAIDRPCGLTLDASELRNISTGKPVGFSQVTSVVRRVSAPQSAPSIYEVGFVASLHDSGFVRLARHVEVAREEVERVVAAAAGGEVEHWRRAVLEARLG